MTRRAFYGLAILVSGFVWCRQALPQTRDAAQEFSRALALQSAGDFPGAIQAYRQALAMEPSSFQAHANLGAALAHEGQYNAAIAEYKAALTTAPPQAMPALHQNIGLSLYKSAQFAEAAAEFDSVRRADPRQLNPVLLESDCYLRMGDFGRVIELLTPFETSEPDNRALAYLLGMALIRNGQPERGQALVDRLLRDGESAETHYLLGSVAFMAKDYPAAVKEFSLAVERDPSLPSLYSFLGQALLFSGDPDAAADAFRKQLSADANDYDANLQLAEILRTRRDFQAARPLFDKALSLRPASIEARYGLAACDLAAGRTIEARKSLEALVTDSPRFADAHTSLAEVYDRLGMKNEAGGERALAAKLSGASADAGFSPGAKPPDFALLSASGETRVRLSSFRGREPVVVVFGSYTCPKFRSQVDALNTLYDRYHDRAGFLLVYIREAHGDSSWQSTANQREGVSLADATDFAQKREHAALCLRKLKIRYPAVVDAMDGATEKLWSAFPSRVYVIDRSGKVVFNSLLDQQRFDAVALETAIKSTF